MFKKITNLDFLEPKAIVSVSPRINIDETIIKNFAKQINHIFVAHNFKFANQVAQAKVLASLNLKKHYGSDAPVKDVWLGLIRKLTADVESMMKLLIQIPGIRESDKSDFQNIIKFHLFDYNLV